MKMRVFFLLILISPLLAAGSLRLKSIARLQGLQENPLTGYGLVIGLAGSGDSRRTKDTNQAISNVLQHFGMNVAPQDINSKNSATVIITANLPAFAHQGDKLDIHVASLGDARSLVGGTLLATPLKGPDNHIYALAQGPVFVGGFQYDQYGNTTQKNHPTTGMITGGAIVERTLYNDLKDKTGDLHLLLNRPDFTTAVRIEETLNKQFGPHTALARSAQDIEIYPPKSLQKRLVHFYSALENVIITPDQTPVILINERTGVIIAGADVHILPVTISQGNLQIAISSEYQVSQPALLDNPGPGIQTAVTPATNIQTRETQGNTLHFQRETTVAELIDTLTKARASPRDIISILQSLQRAGALQAELIIQ